MNNKFYHYTKKWIQSQTWSFHCNTLKWPWNLRVILCEIIWSTYGYDQSALADVLSSLPNLRSLKIWWSYPLDFHPTFSFLKTLSKTCTVRLACGDVSSTKLQQWTNFVRDTQPTSCDLRADLDIGDGPESEYYFMKPFKTVYQSLCFLHSRGYRLLSDISNQKMHNNLLWLCWTRLSGPCLSYHIYITYNSTASFFTCQNPPGSHTW